MTELMKIRRNFNVNQSGDWIVYRKNDPFQHQITMVRSQARDVKRWLGGFANQKWGIASIEKRTPCYLYVKPSH